MAPICTAAQTEQRRTVCRATSPRCSVYGDGPDFHFDYYNSFVIQPMLLDIYASTGVWGGGLARCDIGVAGEEREWDALAPGVVRRAVRYAEVQERLIAPDGSFPPLGRSLAYRCALAAEQMSDAFAHADKPFLPFVAAAPSSCSRSWQRPAGSRRRCRPVRYY